MRRERSRMATTLAGAGLAVAAAVATAVEETLASTAAVTVQNTAVGVTPRYLGLNMGHYLPGSNTTAWTQYSGINAMRVWASANDYEGADDLSPYGDGVTTLEQFQARRAAVRANPESAAYINWPLLNDRFQNKTQSGRNKVRLNHILSELHASGIEPILNLTRTESYDYTGWGGRWEQWQFSYAMAYHAARHYDVQRFQWYNEPDQNNSTISISEYADRLRVTSDAIRAAVADVNQRYGKSLVANISAPTTKDGASKVDTWGQPILQANRTDYAGRPIDHDVFDTYDLHRYNSLGSSFEADLATLATKIPQYNASGAMMPVTYTEFNRYNSSTFASSASSLDTPSVFTEYANDYVGAIDGDVKGLYAFKFGQTWWDPGTGVSEPMKTGHYYVENAGLYNVTGATQGAEVARLIARGFENERPRLGQSVTASNSKYDSLASYDAGRGNYHFLSVNRNLTATYEVTLDLSAWNVPAGQVIAVQEVSAAHHGSVPQFLTVPANRIVTFTQPISSVWLLTAPSGAAPQQRVDLAATADATVSHALPLVNFGLLPSAHVSRAASSDADEATYLKFNLGGNAKANVSRAFLQLTGQNVNNADSTTLHVYGIHHDEWNELTINWNNAPNLAGAADAKLANVGSDAFPVGQLTWDDALGTWGIDVTDFVRKHPDADLSFVLIREQRFGPNPQDLDGDADASRIQLATREAATGKPQLSLHLYDRPLHIWQKNGSAGGHFSSGGSWDVGAAPNTPGAVALMGDFITAAQRITVDAPHTVGELRFDSHHPYTLTGLTQPITISVAAGGGNGAITIHKGRHAIDAPITLASHTLVDVNEGLELTISQPIAGGSGWSLNKLGAGTLRLTAANTYSGSTNVLGGTMVLEASQTRGSSFTAQGDATVELAPGGDKILRTGALAIDGTARVDLADNRLITTTEVGATGDGTTYSGVTGMIQRGQRTGAGLVSTLSSALTMLGVVDASAILNISETETAQWSGQTVTGAETLVMYTYGGDANLDGLISGDDYTAIDFAIATPGADGWASGDFNYDGFISGDDYTIIDFNIAAQGAPFPAVVATGAMTAIPEPVACGLLASMLAAGTLLGRGRRRRRRHRGRHHSGSGLPLVSGASQIRTIPRT